MRIVNFVRKILCVFVFRCSFYLKREKEKCYTY